ncbi:MAG: HDOD domain-containing protein, partial [Gammaproteobacteria bacterium]|nr:HDOD domain-containing protein [Gammaproteobacteria bacterium]
MTDTNLESLYQGILDRVLENDFHLPSMPDIAMKVRSAITKDITTVDSLTEIISKDPSLTAYLVQAASSPVFRRAVAPKTLSDVIGLLGFSSTSSMVMVYSMKDMVEITDPEAKELFQQTWDRLVVKTSIASFLAQKLKFHPVDHVQMAMLLTEVGSLAVLGAMLQESA